MRQLRSNSKNEISGRVLEKNILKQVVNSNKSEFLALYGRRRVGKTYLIRNFFVAESCYFFHVSGIQKGSLEAQLEQFAKQIGVTFYAGASITPRKRWLDAFEDLTKAILECSGRKKIILFLDELPWMSVKRSGLLQALDYYWNRYWTHESKIKLVVCGSSASFMLEKIINSKGGLHNRVTRILKLEPFMLGEAKEFLKYTGVKLSDRQILELYLVLGGVPHYLALCRKGLSAEQCIEELCFRKEGPLKDEFERLFASLFQESDIYVHLIKAIAQCRYGIGQAKLMQEKQFPAGGRLVHRLKELEEAGFIQSFIPYGHQEKGIYYRVIDEFCLFYLHWMTGKKNRNLQSPAWKSWAGYAFEAVCYKHIPQIRRALQIDSKAQLGSWRSAVGSSEEQSGAQIDLLFDRLDDAITVCEIKHAAEPFVIDKTYAKNFSNKIEIYRKRTATKKQIFLAMITVNGLKKSIYSEELVAGTVELEDLMKS